MHVLAFKPTDAQAHVHDRHVTNEILTDYDSQIQLGQDLSTHITALSLAYMYHSDSIY